MTGGGARRGAARRAVLVALCGLGTLLWNFPMLAVWDGMGTIFGLPALPVALFAIWAGLIAMVAFLSERRD